ncbi:hypothetical protein B0I35DRAFT_206231 [Stachybotrys elegans]|uniref:Transcription initiation factor TFIID subunit 4 n=1 Tax=Stachybotrys elegans TaxID=80388 RepID=A0A8K0SXS8_9HYPO|nr:hypothetical protein B0I35DRAFT_206231 [Stachybotrys elegans]
MAQPQSQPPPRAFSPPQPTPSPVAPSPSFALPPNKRVRTDGPSSQPGSPYPASPYAMSPTTGGNTPTNAGSPTYAVNTPTPGAHPVPYTNGHANTGLTLPDTRAAATPPMHTPPPIQTPVPLPQYTTATMTPMMSANVPPTQTPGPGVMGPPQRPAERPTKDYEYDVTDSLAGTGIDLRAEEQYMSELYSNYDAAQDPKTGFAQNPAGPKSSFYGAGPANQPAQSIQEQDQNRFAEQAAEQAWKDSAMRLAASRAQEVNDAFLLVPMVHLRADKIAREHGISLNLDLKSIPAMGKLRTPEQFPPPRVTVKTTPGPDSTMVQTYGSFIPHDAYLADQIALLSLATKHRLREMVGDAHVVASTRQKTSHGDVPEEWTPASAPPNAEPLEKLGDDAGASEAMSAISPGTNTLKRPSDAADLPNGAPPTKLPKIASYMTATMRELARQEREWEEARLRKRQKRKDGITDSTSTASRAGSVAAGTPGSVAPDLDKALSKKEMKKNQALKAAEANSHANQNMTSSMFAGLGGKGSLFGKKKTGKTYDWMNLGRGGSGASTPTRTSSGTGKGPGASVGSPAPANMAMTTEGRNRLGTWREDKEKGKNIQLRDWVVVLERDGRELRALQQAYINLDASTPR